MRIAPVAAQAVGECGARRPSARSRADRRCRTRGSRSRRANRCRSAGRPPRGSDRARSTRARRRSPHDACGNPLPKLPLGVDRSYSRKWVWRSKTNSSPPSASVRRSGSTVVSSGRLSVPPGLRPVRAVCSSLVHASSATNTAAVGHRRAQEVPPRHPAPARLAVDQLAGTPLRFAQHGRGRWRDVLTVGDGPELEREVLLVVAFLSLLHARATCRLRLARLASRLVRSWSSACRRALRSARRRAPPRPGRGARGPPHASSNARQTRASGGGDATMGDGESALAALRPPDRHAASSSSATPPTTTSSRSPGSWPRASTTRRRCRSPNRGHAPSRPSWNATGCASGGPAAPRCSRTTGHFPLRCSSTATWSACRTCSPSTSRPHAP